MNRDTAFRVSQPHDPHNEMRRGCWAPHRMKFALNTLPGVDTMVFYTQATQPGGSGTDAGVKTRSTGGSRVWGSKPACSHDRT